MEVSYIGQIEIAHTTANIIITVNFHCHFLHYVDINIAKFLIPIFLTVSTKVCLLIHW